jgi:hypothetical protein
VARTNPVTREHVVIARQSLRDSHCETVIARQSLRDSHCETVIARQSCETVMREGKVSGTDL